MKSENQKLINLSAKLHVQKHKIERQKDAIDYTKLNADRKERRLEQKEVHVTAKISAVDKLLGRPVSKATQTTISPTIAYKQKTINKKKK